MKTKKILLILLIAGVVVYLTPKLLFSDDLGKANSYYEKYDFKFAIEIYKKLIVKKPSLEVAQKLANCYRFINDSEEAEKAYKTVLTFPGFDPINYLYYAEMLKQNGKFDIAKTNFLMYAERIPEKADYAVRLANGCDAARLWLQNPDLSVNINNETNLNTESAEFSLIGFNGGFIFCSDRVFNKDHLKKDEIYGWTGNSYLKLYEAESKDSLKSDSIKMSLFPKEINNEYHVGPATISHNGDTLYFTRTEPHLDNGQKIKKGGVIKKTIYYSIKKNGIWTESVSFQHNNPLKYSIQHPAINAQGNILYFVSDMPGGFGGMDIYYSEKTGSNWSIPINCGPIVNSVEDDVFPYVKKDGTLYFSSKGHITIGGLDIFSSKGGKADWSDPENLKAPYNSTKDDFGIFYYHDQLGYFSSNRQGGKGSDDIYRFTKTKEKIFYAVEGKVVQKDSDTPLEGLQIFLLNKDNGSQISVLSAADGSFRFNLDAETSYIVKGDLEKYFAKQEGAITTKGVKESTIFNVKFEIEKGEDAYLVILNNIYYDFDKATIRQDAMPELAKVISFMNSTPNVAVELRAHTDARGKADYNMKLSESRAAAAMNYIVQKGVDDLRLSSKGFGETQLLNRCADGAKCSDQEHQSNRRTEFKVIKVNPVMSFIPAPVKNKN